MSNHPEKKKNVTLTSSIFQKFYPYVDYVKVRQSKTFEFLIPIIVQLTSIFSFPQFWGHAKNHDLL